MVFCQPMRADGQQAEVCLTPARAHKHWLVNYLHLHTLAYMRLRLCVLPQTCDHVEGQRLKLRT